MSTISSAVTTAPAPNRSPAASGQANLDLLRDAVADDLVRPLVSIALDGHEGKYRACPRCGHRVALLTRGRFKPDGTVTHHGGMCCERCGRHLGWLREAEVQRLLSGKAF
jgi:hypothetical protein